MGIRSYSYSGKREKEKLVELAAKNAKMVLEKDKERIKREEGRTIGAVKEIEKLLGLNNLVRMEAYDISNTNGFASVGSMIVYERGKPKRNDYRKFQQVCRGRMIMQVCVRSSPEDSGMVWRNRKAGKSWEVLMFFRI